jgi:hypothetical protein
MASLRNSATGFQMGIVAPSNTTLPMSGCPSSAIARRRLARYLAREKYSSLMARLAVSR